MTEYVQKYYIMDPKTEDLIRGVDIQNGMKILVEDPDKRVSITASKLGQMDELQRVADTWNRWMTVSDLWDDNRGYHFIGIFDDGTKRTFTTFSHKGWYVKKDTIPGTNEWAEKNPKVDERAIAAEKANRVLKVIQGAMHRDVDPQVLVDEMIEIILHDCAENKCFQDGIPFPHRNRVDIPVYVPEPDFGPVKSELVGTDEALDAIQRKLDKGTENTAVIDPREVSPSTGITLDELAKRTKDLM